MRKSWLVIAFAFSCLGLKAQNLFFGASYGVSGYSGDLVPGSIDVLELNRSYGVQLRLDLGKLLALRSGIQKMQISGNDQNYATLIPYLDRGLAFQNDLWEASAIVELNFLRFGAKRTLSAASLFGGLSAYSSHLTILKDGEPIEETTRLVFNDQILRINPQSGGKSRGISFPVGVALKIFPSAKSCLEFRTGLRLAGGDSLDGVSHEGAITTDKSQSPSEALPGGFGKQNDLYFFTGLAVSVRIF